MSTVAEKQAQTAKALIDGYNNFNTDGPEGIFRYRSNDCMQELLPASMQWPAQTNTEHRDFLSGIHQHLKGFKVTIEKIVNAPEQHMAVLHATGTAETVWAPYRNEFALFLTFDEAGEKVVRMEEFVDSKFTADFLDKMQAHFKAQE